VLQKLLDRLPRSARARHRQGLRRGRRGLPVEPAGEAVPRHVRPPDRRAPDQDRIVRDVSPERFRAITESTLEGLAKKELNLSAIVGKSAEAKERRLVPEVVEQFFVEAAPETGLHPKPTARRATSTASARCRGTAPIGDRQEARFGRLGREYGKIVFDKALLPKDPTLEWVTPGHPLFEAVRTTCLARTDDHLRAGRSSSTCTAAPGAAGRLRRLDQGRPRQHAAPPAVRGRNLAAGEMTLSTSRPVARHHPGPKRHAGPRDARAARPQRRRAVPLRTRAPTLGRQGGGRARPGVERVAKHVEISLNALIDRQQQSTRRVAQSPDRRADGPGLDGI
jgi:hypothetical protein